MVDTVEPGSVNVFDPYDGQVKVGKPEGEWDGKNHLFDSFNRDAYKYFKVLLVFITGFLYSI